MNTLPEGHIAASATKNYSVWLLVLLLVVLLFSIRLLLPWILFRPTREHFHTPEDYGLTFEDVTLATSDGVKLNGWYVPAPEARGTLLFFHGNTGNISHRLDSIEIFHDLGLSVFIVDYRGYGKSGGRRSIPGVTEDALSAWRYLTKARETSPDDIVVFGRSIGGAVAMQLMRHVTPRALILESTFSSLPEMIRVPFLVPVVRLLIGDVFNSAEVASKLKVPTLYFHSPDDDIVPYRLGRRLYEAAAGEKTFVELSGGHNEGFLESTDVYRPALDEFFTKHLGS